MWASGDYPSMVETFLTPLGPRLVEAAGIQAGQRVLDVAAGSDALPVPAATSSTFIPAPIPHASTSRGPSGSRNVSTIDG